MARAKTEPEIETDPDDGEAVTKGEVREMISGALSEIKGLLTGNKDPETPETPDEPSAPETNDELPSPRRIELDTERAVRDAIGGIHINISPQKEETPKKEKEETPGGVSALTRFIWGNDHVA